MCEREQLSVGCISSGATIFCLRPFQIGDYILPFSQRQSDKSLSQQFQLLLASSETKISKPLRLLPLFVSSTSPRYFLTYSIDLVHPAQSQQGSHTSFTLNRKGKGQSHQREDQRGRSTEVYTSTMHRSAQAKQRQTRRTPGLLPCSHLGHVLVAIDVFFLLHTSRAKVVNRPLPGLPTYLPTYLPL